MCLVRPGRILESAGRSVARMGTAAVEVWTALRDGELSVDECLAAVRAPGVGGIVFFVGTVRDSDAGRDVVELEYSAHPSAAAAIDGVARRVAAETDVLAVAVVHRVGVLAVGDPAVIVAAGAAHRAAAFVAARRLIDDVKAAVPIWKRQVFADGGTEWVGTP
jgi:molybdopterin synthase catalytic subunit